MTSADVYRLLTPIWTTKRAMASKVKATIGRVFSWAIANDFVKTNPVQAVNGALPKAGGKVQHHRALPWQEVPAMLEKVDGSGAAETTKLCVRLLTLTACRSGEVRGASWDEFDGTTWTIPASRMKEGAAHVVPLSEAALAVLERSRELTGGDGLVFKSWTGRSITAGALSKLFSDLELGCVPHGMRSSFRVWAAEADIPREIAEFCLAHVVGSAAERAYQRSDLYQQRGGVMERWAAACS